MSYKKKGYRDIDRLDQNKEEIIKSYTKDLLSLEKIQSIFNVDRKIVSKFLKSEGIEVSHVTGSKHKLDENFFETINTQEKAYILGLLYADGCVSTKINHVILCFSEIDIELLEDVRDILAPINTIRSQIQKISAKEQCRLVVCNSKIKQDLIKHGCVPAKSLILKQPTTIPSHLIRHFIRGYFDGDGCISKTLKSKRQTPSWTVEIAGTQDVVTFIQQHLCNQLQVTKNKIGTVKNIFRVRYGSRKDIENVYQYLYQDASIFLKRKYIKFQEFLNLKHNVV